MKFLIALLLAVAVATVSLSCGDDDDATETPSPTPTGSVDGTPSPTATELPEVCASNPDPATEEDLLVTSPEAGDELVSPITISGEAPEFDGRVWFRAYDADGAAIFDQGGSTNFGHLDEPFEDEVTFSVSQETPTCIEVYLLRPSEGGVTDVVQIPVLLLPEGSASPQPTVTGGDVTDVCPHNPDPADESEVTIDGPEPGDMVSSPFAVTGSAAAFEAAIQITLLDADGNELADQPGMTNEGQTLAPFEETVEFTVDEETDGCLQVYMLSAQDGEPVNIAQVPLVLLPASE